MATKVTIQDIADALGVSRNTVSKAINNTGILADSTREKVLQKAIEMGYKQFSYANSISDIHNPSISVPPTHAGEIALFTGNFLGNSHFASTMLDKFQHELSLIGYSMSIHRVNKEDFESRSLPNSFRLDKTSAIMCIEMFDYAYCEMLCDLDIPVLLVDAPVATYGNPLNADVLLMNNSANIFKMVGDMKERGLTKIGFIGQISHCRSFFERFLAFQNGMLQNGLEINPAFCITEVAPKSMKYHEWVRTKLEALPSLPDLFICANDFIVIDVLSALKSLNLSCPRDVRLFGFDDSQESKIITPSLSTCHIHSQVMGFSAVHLLMTRIHQPDLNYRIVYTETDLIYRESTQ